MDKEQYNTLTCTAVYAIARGCTDFMFSSPATSQRVRRSPAVLRCFGWPCADMSFGLSSSWSSISADVGDVKMNLNVCK